jgi:hypothetical protein
MVTAPAPPLVRAVHGRDLLTWHGVSAAAMLAMVAVTLPVWLAGAAAAVFATGLVWCAVQAVRLRPRAPYLRLGVCSLAMLAMLVPLAAPGLLTAGPAGHTMAGHTMAGHTMAGHTMAATPTAAGALTSAGPGLLALLLAGMLACLAVWGVARGVRRPTAGRSSRTADLAEALLAATMAAMLLGAV